MAKNNKICTICGNSYNYCAKCERLGGYKFYADTPECYQVFEIMREYREGIITAIEAKSQFERIEITIDGDFSKYLEAVTRDIKMIIEKGTIKTVSKNSNYNKK